VASLSPYTEIRAWDSTFGFAVNELRFNSQQEQEIFLFFTASRLVISAWTGRRKFSPVKSSLYYTEIYHPYTHTHTQYLVLSGGTCNKNNTLPHELHNSHVPAALHYL
jgi:hypothetical protein